MKCDKCGMLGNNDYGQYCKKSGKQLNNGYAKEMNALECGE